MWKKRKLNPSDFCSKSLKSLFGLLHRLSKIEVKLKSKEWNEMSTLWIKMESYLDEYYISSLIMYKNNQYIANLRVFFGCIVFQVFWCPNSDVPDATSNAFRFADFFRFNTLLTSLFSIYFVSASFFVFLPHTFCQARCKECMSALWSPVAILTLKENSNVQHFFIFLYLF